MCSRGCFPGRDIQYLLQSDYVTLRCRSPYRSGKREVTALKTVFMFPGQGSQYYHMGKSLYEKNEKFRQCMSYLDGIIRDLCGISVLASLYSDLNRKSDPFDQIILTHPAIFMIEYALAQTLIHAGVIPDIVLGSSLGSFAAATIAGCMHVEQALYLVIRQAQAIQESCDPGGMIAILSELKLLNEVSLSDRCEVAAVNYAGNFVISARLEHITEIELVLQASNVSYHRLPVHFAFHSKWIDKAKSQFESFMGSMQYDRANLPIVCCEKSAALFNLPANYFWRIVRYPIQFGKTIERLDGEGPHRYIDVGPSGTMATFLKYGLPATTKSVVHSILTPFGLDEKSLAAIISR